jgi:hydrogenase expression/formation protein HypC
MCLGSIVRLTETWDEEGARVGRLDNGSVVSLAFLPEASAGAYVLVHVGIPVEVVDPDTAREALALRSNAELPEEARR